MFTVYFTIRGRFDNYRDFNTLKEARDFAATLKDTIYVDITDGDKQYELEAPKLH
ncbi:hypothetical protein HOT32_gp78 [Erwinia phage Faunus]|uniref:Uncharacterized protein n=1 Tax=Erwinia phage Faunus TaxID=2182346 RepID=A0A2U8UWM4_9CAUD|nr:hypothetical protein HOT32_gp78 [Erwinia phage Faunus]AWN08661.1 hypothetical protein [Erwinia phage Faunus]